MTSETGREPLSVGQAVGLAKSTVESMPTLVVTGEVSGFRGPARTGHCYFQLKDDSAAMDAIVWRGIYQASGVELRDGLQVLVTGGFQVYAPTGRLSFVAKSLQVSGEGVLRQQVAALAKRLAAEGLMDPARKRRVPTFCTRIAVVTSPTGSVIDDVKRTLARRNPLVEILVSGCAVQGEGAERQIIAALERAAAARPEAILLVRGGGSYEDLMTFNDEALARAVAACPVPVVTGIGHEPDTSICDMVADRRCSTPTAAAESVAPAIDEIERSFHDRERRLLRVMSTDLTARRQASEALEARGLQAMGALVGRLSQQVEALAVHRCLSEPGALLEARETQLELTAQRLVDAMPRLLAAKAAAVEALGSRSCLQDPLSPVRDRRERTERLAERLAASGSHGLERARRDAGLLSGRVVELGGRLMRSYEETVARGAAQLDALSPLRVLGRGYAIARDAGGHVVGSVQGVSAGDSLTVLVSDGEIQTTVAGVMENDK